MRIAVLFHALQLPHEVESEYLVDLLADRWRQQGHEVRFLIGCRQWWPADVVIVHVDLSVVPWRYLRFARKYPIAINGRIVDIRKSAVSRCLVARGARYEGPVIVKTDLNSAGIPERRLRARAPARRLLDRARRVIPVLGPPAAPLEYVKRYTIYESVQHVPAGILADPAFVVEQFHPEMQDNLYFTRRCYLLGDRAVTHRLGRLGPFDGGVAEAFEWVDNSPEVLRAAREAGLDFGCIDYTEHRGEAVIFDVNKTVGVSALENDEVRRNFDRTVQELTPGLACFVAGSAGMAP
jgi:hypothetical protein